jgi:hypothetical protein
MSSNPIGGTNYVTCTQQAEATKLGARYTGKVGSPFMRTVINIMGPTRERMRGAPICHPLLNLEVYINPNQETELELMEWLHDTQQ